MSFLQKHFCPVQQLHWWSAVCVYVYKRSGGWTAGGNRCKKGSDAGGETWTGDEEVEIKSGTQ